MISPAIQPSRAAPAHTTIGKALEQRHDDGGAGHDQRNADGKSEHQQRVALRRFESLGDRGDGDDIVEAHHHIGDGDDPDRAPQTVDRLDLPLLPLSSGPSSLTAIHSSSTPPTSLR